MHGVSDGPRIVSVLVLISLNVKEKLIRIPSETGVGNSRGGTLAVGNEDKSSMRNIRFLYFGFLAHTSCLIKRTICSKKYFLF